MSKRRIYRACLAWILAICMVFSGSAWTGLTAYAAGEATTGDEEIVPGETGVVGETEGTEIQETDEDGEGGEVTQGEDPVEPTGKVTITFNYGLNEEALKKVGYKFDGAVFSTKIEVNKGESWDDVQWNNELVFPQYGQTINHINFSYWSLSKVAKSKKLDGDYKFEEDTTIYAHWSHHITYHAEEGHFYNQEKGGTYTSGELSENETLLDLSICCYPEEGTTRAFVDWGVEIEDELVPIRDLLKSQFAVYENIDLYAIFTDGYSLTYNVNLDGASIGYYYESYKDSDGRNSYGDYKNLYNTTTLTFTYPKGVKPSDANYFCYAPVQSANSGNNPVEFSDWSKDSEGNDITNFYSLNAPAEGNLTMYAVWKKYWVVTFDPNGKGYYSPQSYHVIKGNTISSIPTFEYTDNETGSYQSVSFNTKADGKGDKIDYSYKPTSDVTVYAQYKGIYKISLDENDAERMLYNPSPYNVDRGKAFDYDLKSLVVLWPDEYNDKGEITKYSRKVLKEWNTKPDGTGVTPSSEFIPTSDTTLYAIPEDGVLVTFHTGAVNDNDYGTIFSFRDKDIDRDGRSDNMTDGTFAYRKNSAMNGDVPYIEIYINSDNKKFAGWSLKRNDPSQIIDTYTYTPTEDVDLYAIWYDLIPNTYHAGIGAFPYPDEDGHDDSHIDRAVKGENFSPYNAEEPYLDGYVFSGWKEKESDSKIISRGTTYKATEPMDFYAAWEKGYTITLDGNGGNIEYMSGSGHENYDDRGKATFTIKKGSPVLERFTSSDEEYGHGHYHESGLVRGYRDDGLILAGWSKTKDGEKVDLYSYIPEGDETFYAVWETPCIVTYDADGGKLNYENSTEVVKGGHVDFLPTPSAQDKYFVGWFLEDGTTRFDKNTVVNSNITVKAKWSDKAVTVILDAGEGAVIGSSYDSYDSENARMVTITLAESALIDLSRYTPRRTDSADVVFGGWTAENYTWSVGSSDSLYTVTKNITFTAKWDTTVYCDVVFDGNGGQVINPIDASEPEDTKEVRVVKGDSIGIMVYAKKQDSDFTGWYSDPECTKLVSSPDNIASYKPESDITLYAGWKEEVKIPVKDISLSKEKITLGVKTVEGKPVADKYELKVIFYPVNATNTDVTYESSDSAVATVTSKGVITAVKEGTAVITVKSADGNITKTCDVKVDSMTTASVNDTLDEATRQMVDEKGDAIISEEKAKETLDNVLKEMGNTDTGKAGAERLADMAASDKNIAKKLEDLEKAYVTAAGITVNDPSKNKETVDAIGEAFGITEEEAKQSIGVSGAGLSVEPGDTVDLSVSTVAEGQEKEIDENYENARQVDINLSVKNAEGENKTVEELDAPVTVTLPIPSGMIVSKLYILHFNEATGKFEIIRPTFKNNAMSFTVSHFSRFAFVELAETITPSGGNGGEDQPTTPGGNDPATPGGNDPTTPGGNGSTTPSGTNPTTPVGTDTTTTGSTTETPAASVVKDGDAVSEAGSTARYTVSSATDKTVAYTGDTAASGKITIKSTVTDGTNTYTVTSIADGAFKKSKVTAVTIPETVDSIGKGAFEGSTKLKTLTIKGTKLTSIGDNAFKGCSALTKVTLPKNVKTVGKNAFSNCKKLKTITVKSKKTKFAKNSLKGVPKSATIKLPKMTAKEKKAYKKMLKSAGFKGKIK